MRESGFGNITTSNYTYYITIADKFSFLEKRNMEQDYRDLKVQYLWSTNRLDTNAAYQLAVRFLKEASMDVNGLNRDCDVHIEALFPGGKSGKSFVPIYWVYWEKRMSKGHGSMASVEVFEPTRTIRSLRVEDAKYILRKPLQVANVDSLLGQTNTPQAIENPKLEARPLTAKRVLSMDNQVVQSNNVFAFDLYAHLARQPGNLLLSSFSVDAALALTWAGAREENARQIAEVLHLPTKSTNVHAGFSALLGELNETNAPDYQGLVASSLWAQRSQPFVGTFQKLAHEQYGAALIQTDLGRGAISRQQINNWARFQTHDQIPEILPPEFHLDNAPMLLVNAACFKGYWATPFRDLTQNLPFHLVAGESVSVPMMHQSAEFNYAENDSLQFLEMPYVSNRFSLVLLLPKKTNGLPETEKTFSLAQIEQLQEASRREQVSVFLPRFKGASEFNLTGALKDMGMTNAFSVSNASFSGISRVKPFYLGAVLHKTYMEISEEGGEETFTDGAPPAKKEATVTFNADHPFLFLVRHNPTGAILVLGRIANPPVLSNQQADNSEPYPAFSPRNTNALAQLMKRSLNLTDEQVKKLEPVLQKQRADLAELRRETSLSHQERVNKINEMQQANEAQLKAILTPEQTEKWQNRMRDQQSPFPTQRPGQLGQPPGGK